MKVLSFWDYHISKVLGEKHFTVNMYQVLIVPKALTLNITRAHDAFSKVFTVLIFLFIKIQHRLLLG